jgi:hypothetical protein
MHMSITIENEEIKYECPFITNRRGTTFTFRTNRWNYQRKLKSHSHIQMNKKK